jgi:GntR family transcriptional regulator / MocR family aminotransferase
MRTSSSEVLIELDRSRVRGLRVQIEDQLRGAIRSGRVAAGSVLPSSRALAVDLGVTRGVVVAAYDQLVAEGYLESEHGSGTIVKATAAGVPRRRRSTPADDAAVTVDFTLVRPDVALFPYSAWLRATKSALAALPADRLGYVEERGLTELREVLVDYLGRVRGVSADVDHVMVTNGFSHSVTIIATALERLGHDVLAVEDPHRCAADQLGLSRLQLRGVEVDSEGIVVDDLRRSTARAVLVTPAHQAPLGIVMSPRRRTELIAWARDVDGYIVADDYDAEFRYDHHPVGTLQGIAPDRVLYCGTSSKNVAPGLRLGWLVLPPQLVEPFVRIRHATDLFTSSMLQAVFASFVSSGDLDRHLRRSRRLYRQRRDALVDSLARWLPEATPTGVSAGLQMVLCLPPGAEECAVVDHALAAGVRVNGLGEFRTGRRSRLPPALVLGYGPIAPADAERGARLLAKAVHDAVK